jgi:hypothetical protein
MLNLTEIYNNCILNEAVTTYKKKINDPALMTKSEWMDFINRKDEYHGREYEYTLDKNNEFNEKEKFPKLINRIKRNGLSFEIREEKRKVRYVLNDEDGDTIFDDNGKVLMMTDVEMKALGYPLYEYSYAIFDIKTDKCVANAQNEWGAILIYVVEEYQKLGFNFAEVLLDLYRKKYPNADSGGLTDKGYKFIKQYHDKKVRQYLASGFYSHLIKTDQISKEKVQKILKSINEKPKKHKAIDLNFDDTKDFVLHQSPNSPEFIIYNKRIYDIFKDKDLDQALELQKDYYFRKNIIKGHVRFMYMSDPWNAFKEQITYAENDTILNLLKRLVASYIVKNDEKIYLNKDTIKFFNDFKLKQIDKNNNLGIIENFKPINYEGMVQFEKNLRNKYDKYGELETKIIELAYYVSD